MLPRRERIARLAGVFLLNALIAWALSRPLLSLYSLTAEEGMAALLAAGTALALVLLSLIGPRLRFLTVFLGGVGVALLGAFYPASLPARLVAFGWSLMSGASLQSAATIYFDALLPLLMLLLVLYGRFLMAGEPSFSIPLLVTPLILLWFAGVKQNVLVYFPAAAAMPLLYIYSCHSHEAEIPAPLAPRALWLRGAAVALMVALLALALTPSDRQTVPQAEKMADTIRRVMEDHFFFTGSRRMFSLETLGYQPMGDQGLGGRPAISKTPLMRVEAGERVYLRGTALDLYTGREWFDTLSRERYNFQSARFSGLKSSLFDENLPLTGGTFERAANVTLLEEMPSTLFLPQRVRSLVPGGGMVPYFNASTEVFITRDLKPEDSYAFRFEPYVAGEAATDALAASLINAPDPGLARLPNEYTQLPGHLQPQGIVASLARQIAGGLASPYEQGMALMRALRSNYAYSLDVEDAPENLDFVSHFLFDTQTGYCTYFASAMTVLARSLGLPARYVEGFLADPKGADLLTLSGMNAHAWTEIYIAGLGWVAFDATPGEGTGDGQEPESPPPDAPPSPPPQPSPEPSPSPSPQPDPQATPPPPPGGAPPGPQPSETPKQDPISKSGSSPLWWLLLLAAMLALLIWRVRASEPGYREKKMKDPARVLALYWQELLSALRLMGKGIGEEETPLSYAQRLDLDDSGLAAFAAAQSALVYGRAKPDLEALSIARAQYRAVWRQLPPHKQALLALRRAVSPIGRGIKSLPVRVGKEIILAWKWAEKKIRRN